MLEWKKDCWGKERSALYWGGLFVGCISRYFPEGHDWRVANATKPSDEDRVKRNKKAALRHYARVEKTPWRGWFMSSDEGDSTGDYATDDEARASVEAAFWKATGLEPLTKTPQS